MSKITQYPQATSFDSGDFLIKDGINGTKIISIEDAADYFSSKPWSFRVGLRNLVVNTLNPTASPVNSRPHLRDSTIGASGRGDCTVAEHGIRFTINSGSVGNWQYFRFGSSNTSSVNSHLMGLVPGETYTWSFDAEYKLLSGRNETSTDLIFQAQLFATLGSSTSFAKRAFKDIHVYKTSDLTDRGSVLTDRVEFTFTVPETASRLYLDVKMNTTDIKSDYLLGDYIELKNIKLEKGTLASDWSPAPEDIQDMAANRIYWSTRNDTKITTSLTDVIDSLGLGFHIRWNTASDATAVGAPTNNGYHYVINKMEDATAIVYAYRMGTHTFENYQKQKYGVEGWGEWIDDRVPYDFTSQVTVTEGETFTNATRFVRIGKMCCISYQGASKAHAAKSVLCTIPEGFRPANQSFAPFSKNGNAYGTLIIMPNGNVTLDAISSTSAVGRVYFNISYLIQ